MFISFSVRIHVFRVKTFDIFKNVILKKHAKTLKLGV